MGTDPMSDEEREASIALIEAAEARMRQAETFTWAVPGLALAGQAILLTVGLDSGASYRAMAFAAAAGLVTLLPALHFLGKHTFNFDWLDAVIERERIKLGWPRMTRDYLLADITSFPPDTLLRQREWLVDEGRLRRFNWLYRPWARVRYRLVVRLKAVIVWTIALAILGLIDVAVLGYALFHLG